VPATIRTTAQAYRLRVSPGLGHLPLGALSRERVEVWLAELLGSGTSRDAAHKAVKALRVVLAAAVEWGRLPANPAARLRLPRPQPGEGRAAERVLDEAELRRLLEVGAPTVRIETMLRAAAEAGLRRGEVIGLCWPDLHLARRRLAIERSVYQDPGRDGAAPERIVKAPKGGRPRRVAISATFTRRLADWYAVSVVEGGADAAGYVWPGRAGGPMDEGTPGQALERALGRAELVDAEGRPLVTFHGRRHTAASVMLARGVPLPVVARQLGHANPNITATIYAHILGEDHLDRAANVFDPPQDARAMREADRRA
jgi:integrase